MPTARAMAMGVAAVSFSLSGLSAALIQRELVLSTDPQQQASVRGFATVLRPAVRVGNSIYVGVAEPTEDISTEDCYRFYFLQANEVIPEDVQEFVSVVVGVGDTRGYLWRGQMLHSGPCVGAGPKLPK